jgi:hypothetical protein
MTYMGTLVMTNCREVLATTLYMVVLEMTFIIINQGME